ncbi:mitochondrial amino-acid acetyltransferase [Aspergillus heteromorphus CBS 117.55]|uniref:Amino-acid acetyltransferase, mitochondrial n=1 Tax=Aspergillus heteromorphus CBS 117.55 TaxID=1448321 RepID=A0A317V6S8_9EURO|nr:mitochondrial amino-acid acetyltransferase [Aspergillus heteromorphus CBS 117.55]PWY69796.1 mitochondrial amino-acid acetyltransferase [Aspergillus heteromorphus CBS 117.55]
MSSRTFATLRTANPSQLKRKNVSLSASPPARGLPPRRCLSSAPDRQVQQSADFSSSSKRYDRLGRRAKEKLLDREFFLSLLNSASTKREAKSYLARIQAQHQEKRQQNPAPEQTEPPEISIPSTSAIHSGSFYGASRSVYDSPVFRHDSTPAPPQQDVSERLHLALIKVTTPQLLDDTIINGVAKTLSQLNRLGMACCVVVDPGTGDNAHELRKVAAEQVDRISTAIDAQPDSKSAHTDSVLSISPVNPATPKVLSRKALLGPLRDGQIVVVAPIAYTEDVPRAVTVSAKDAILALTKELAGLATVPDPDEDPLLTAQRITGLQKEVSLDRVILLDPLGGIPAFSGPQTSHVFINMEQEYDDIENELLRVWQSATAAKTNLPEEGLPSIADSNPLSKFADLEVVPVPPSQKSYSPNPILDTAVVEGHLDNLRLSQAALAMLPSASSGIITSPFEVANSAQSSESAISDVSAVGTRRQRNPLIHNLLTDKPLLSSSLPLSRRAAVNGGSRKNSVTTPSSHTTFVKRGMPLTVIPNPWASPWTAQTRPLLGLDDPCIDLPRLVHLIEDSFNRKLDVQDYLNRVNGRLAGLIIAGEYEGGAILTWELPPGVKDDGSAASQARMVPYLDKFAVLKRSQGAGGVADIVFNAMIRSCFPNGVCWRSRKDNPVNKWYFERSQGTWKLADTNWTMFWTTPGLPEDAQKFQDYEDVCRSIEPSWADDTGVVD